MTICIVGRCKEKDSFIVAGDRLFSYSGLGSYESISLKRLPLTVDLRWHCMFSGSVSNVLPIVRRARKEIGFRQGPHRLELVERSLVQAYQDHREQLVNDGILSIYKMDLATYRRKGLKFPPDECARINRLIEEVQVGVDFIIYGYDDLNFAHLFTLCETPQPPFMVESLCHDNDGIAAIGCGSTYAAVSLLSKPILPILSQVEMLCRICEAKFDAEQDPDVGKDSAAGVINKAGSTVESASTRFLTLPALDAIRDAHARRNDRPYPKELLEALMVCIDSNYTTERMEYAVWRAEQMIIAEDQQKRGGT